MENLVLNSCQSIHNFSTQSALSLIGYIHAFDDRCHTHLFLKYGITTVFQNTKELETIIYNNQLIEKGNLRIGLNLAFIQLVYVLSCITSLLLLFNKHYHYHCLLYLNYTIWKFTSTLMHFFFRTENHILKSYNFRFISSEKIR